MTFIEIRSQFHGTKQNLKNGINPTILTFKKKLALQTPPNRLSWSSLESRGKSHLRLVNLPKKMGCRVLLSHAKMLKNFALQNHKRIIFTEVKNYCVNLVREIPLRGT
jgi:hypothetical protein